MIYAIADISFLGNDDVHFQGYVIKSVPSVEHWEAQMRQSVESEFESGYMTIYHSDNDGTPFENVQEVMDTITIHEIDENIFNVLKQTLGESYGMTTSFMEA